MIRLNVIRHSKKELRAKNRSDIVGSGAEKKLAAASVAHVDDKNKSKSEEIECFYFIVMSRVRAALSCSHLLFFLACSRIFVLFCIKQA